MGGESQTNWAVPNAYCGQFLGILSRFARYIAFYRLFRGAGLAILSRHARPPPMPARCLDSATKLTEFLDKQAMSAGIWVKTGPFSLAHALHLNLAKYDQ